MNIARALPLVVLALLLPACSDPFVTLGPTPSDQGITFYLHAGFAGPSQAVNVDVRDLGKVEGPCSGGAEGERPTWGDCMSSLRVISGWTVTLYEDKDFHGRSPMQIALGRLLQLAQDHPGLDAGDEVLVVDLRDAV